MSDKCVINLLLCISVAALVLPYLIRWIYRIVKTQKGTTIKRSGVNGILMLSLCILVSVWCLRYAVGYHAIVNFVPNPETGEIITLTWYEEVFNSFVHALQTFSMDEDYTDYIMNGRLMLIDLYGENTVLDSIYGIYASVLNTVAPIAGGAMILELLVSIFPKLKLYLSFLLFWKKKYYFSELTKASVALAKNISDSFRSTFRKPIIIFSDTFADDTDETRSETIIEAKQLGAICVKDDISHIAKSNIGEREYYLIGENEFENLQALSKLVDPDNLQYLKNSYVYLFVKTDAYVKVEKQIKKLIKSEKTKNTISTDELPIIVPIKIYRNLVNNLFSEVPLYEPLVDKDDPTSLNVTIFGNSEVGTEAFFGVYWLGQMFISEKTNGFETASDCQVTINVVSDESEEEFWAKLNHVNPEIRNTVEILDGKKSKNNNARLEYNEKGDKNLPYCKVRYVSSNVKHVGFWHGEDEKLDDILSSDYFIVTLCDDADNITVAEKLRSAIAKLHIEEKKVPEKAVIAYAVFDSELSLVLNEQKLFKSNKNADFDVYMHAFGSLDQLYSCENIYMSKNMLWAQETLSAYNKEQHKTSHEQEVKERSNSDNYENADYNYWSNLARASHLKYKVFSLGWIKTSLFETSSSASSHRESVKTQCDQYRLISSLPPSKLPKELLEKYNDVELKKHLLAWLEHRRWNAFARTLGFQYADCDVFKKMNIGSKDLSLKLHTCLVEARRPSLDANESFERSSAEQELDKLDKVSETFNTNYKRYDYNTYELSEYDLIENIINSLEKSGVKNAKKYCDPKKIDGVIHFKSEDGEKIYVSVDEVKTALSKKTKK